MTITLVSLTPRQQEVAWLVSEGLTNAAIGEEIYCAEMTVKGHITAIAERLEDAGLLSPDDRCRINVRIAIARWVWEQQALNDRHWRGPLATTRIGATP